MKYTILLFLAITISGCVIVEKTYAPDGREAYWLDCLGAAAGACYLKAGEICGSKGYEIIKEKGEQDALITGGSSGVIVNESESTIDTKTTIGMMIICK